MLSSLSLILLLNFISCNDDESCEYVIADCEETCEIFEDFEDETIGSAGNWQSIANSAIGVSFDTATNSNVLAVQDGSGESLIFNTADFPTNLLDGGCELKYDARFDFSTANASNSLIIYQGTSPLAYTFRAQFSLNPTSAHIVGGAMKTIAVPLELASGTSLPSNSYGEWKLIGASNPLTTTDITNFNNLIQNIDGVSMRIDGAGGTESWWFDNFCFTQCCPE